MEHTISKPLMLSGRYFSKKELRQIQETVKMFPNLSRTELAFTICEHLSWTTPKGSNKINSCLSAIGQLENLGYIKLPPKKIKKKRVTKKIVYSDKTVEGTPILCSLEEISPLELRIVKDKDEVSLWNEYVDRYHYLGYKHPIGDTLRYFIVSKKPDNRLLGCLMFTTAVWHLSDRDTWIGWDKKDREKRLNLIVNNNRFLIFPWVKVENLAGKALSIAVKQIQNDWQQECLYRPVLIETFVDASKYSGSCYRAANWQCIGKTTGKAWKDEANTDKTSGKTIFVYPLESNFRAILKNQKENLQNDQVKVDENFINLWGKVITIIAEVAHEFDKIWQKRKRIIDSMLLIFLIFRLLYSKNSQGYGTTISDFWNNCRKMKFPLPQKEPICASALTQARSKLDETIFKVLNKRIISAYEEETNKSYRLNNQRIFAVDGSKINLPRELIEEGYKTPSDNAHYPQGLVSCLYQLKSKIPYDFDLVKHGDERKCALLHLRSLKENDIVVYDRGYFSYAMLYYHVKAGVYPVFRLQKNTYKEIEEFRNSDQVDQIITINPSTDTSRDIKKKFPDIIIVPLRFRLIKYTVAETTYCIGTTLMDKQYEINLFKDIYHSRWGIEELYKVSKEFIIVDDFHGKTERGVKQELFAHFALITMNRLCSNKAEDQLSKILAPLSKKDDSTSEIKVNFKNCLATVSRHLEEIMFVPANCVKGLIQQIVSSISRYRQKVRPNRSYVRKSMKPIKKWRTR
jgi:hypothetical protein